MVGLPGASIWDPKSMTKPPDSELVDMGLQGGLFAGKQMPKPARIPFSHPVPLMNAETKVNVQLDVVQNGFGGEPTRWVLTVRRIHSTPD